MPTGYTYAIEQGCTFEEYVWGCARAFGACVMMRDEPMDKPIPEQFEASNWHAEQIEAAKVERAKLDALSGEEIAAAMQAELREIEERNAQLRRQSEEKNRRYEVIRKQVEAWAPPSPDHQNLKRFMLEQIDLCYPDQPYQKDLPPASPAEWLEQNRRRAERDIAYHTEEHAKEIERTRGRNEWLRQLRESVPQPAKEAQAA